MGFGALRLRWEMGVLQLWRSVRWKSGIQQMLSMWRTLDGMVHPEVHPVGYVVHILFSLLPSWWWCFCNITCFSLLFLLDYLIIDGCFIGWEMQMNEYKSTHDFSSSSLGSFIEPRDTNNIVARSTWSSQGMFLLSFLSLVSFIFLFLWFYRNAITWSPRTENILVIIMNSTLHRMREIIIRWPALILFFLIILGDAMCSIPNQTIEQMKPFHGFNSCGWMPIFTNFFRADFV